MSERPYILDNASALEYKRLDLMAKILDPWTRGYLASLDVSPGWHCLELGGGNGSITEWLAQTVGMSGSVMAVDINASLLATRAVARGGAPDRARAAGVGCGSTRRLAERFC